MIAIELERRSVPAGDVVRGRVHLTPEPSDAGRRVELTVLWETEGKGDTDMGVAHFQVLADGDAAAATRTHAFEARLPLAPVSYDGTILKIQWLVRVRRLARLGNDLVVDETFEMVPRA